MTKDITAPENAELPGVASARHKTPRFLWVVQWLLALALLYTLYFAKSLLMPIVVALLFALLLSPLVSLLKRLYIPRTMSAVLILCLIGGPFALVVSQLAEPAQRWAKAIPELSEKLTDQVTSLTGDLSSNQITVPQAQPQVEPRKFRFFGWFGKTDEEQGQAPDRPVQSAQRSDNAVSDRIKSGSLEAVVSALGAAPTMLAQLLTAIILILFLLIFGPRLFAAYVNIFPQVHDKRRSILLVRTIQVELSRYILTVSVINTCLGLTTAAALWLLGVEDALLWGVLVGMLNFAPYIGPLIGTVILCLAGLVQYGAVSFAVVPALVYFAINMLEAQFVTPLVLGRNMRLNPLVIMLWLIIWGWLWGVVGVLLAVPLLVCLKLSAAQLGVMTNWVRLIETRA
ncbi:AI-2E family transporter [Halopseudomonas pelagia]|uniref:AI-2E family transporter n=1 Tax=Halopseudomonas pelagia TaxID=553151 RepID=UPI0030D98F3E|tara:strand:- start:40853 stop:42049 length:1197 start_codon:yes stop_codon:yes gene_type:complete